MNILSLNDVPLILILVLGVAIPTLSKHFGLIIRLSNKDSEHLLNATIDTLIYLFACVGAGILYHLSYGESFITMFIRSVIIIGFFTWYLHSRLETMRTLQAQRQDSHD
jgi:hypothetical protein